MIAWSTRTFASGTVREVRTADHHGTMLVALTRDSGGGTMVIGAGGAAVELGWGCMKEGLAWLEKICAEADAARTDVRVEPRLTPEQVAELAGLVKIDVEDDAYNGTCGTAK